MRPDGPRDPVAGPDSGPEPPFPIRLSGPVIAGFGRGSKELGIPTANIPPAGLSAYPDLPSGVYYGLVGLRLPNTSTPSTTTTNPTPTTPPTTNTTPTTPNNPNPGIYEAVLSIGYNPFYRNTVRSIEIHLLPTTPFDSDFYGAPLNLLVLGFIRPEYDYVSKESLIEDIRIDCEVARRSLGREGYRMEQGAGAGGDGLGEGGGRGEGKEGWREWLLDFGWVESSGSLEGAGSSEPAERKESL